MNTKHTRYGRAKAFLLVSALAAGTASGAEPTDTAASEGEFFSKQFTFEVGPGGVKINGNTATPGVLFAKGTAPMEKVPWLGVATEALDPALAAQLGLAEDEGITVTTTVPGSPAADAGIENFDILLEVDGVKLDSPRTLRELIRGKAEGDVARIALMRKGERREIEATLVVKARAVAEATDSPIVDPAAKPEPRRRGSDPFDDDFFNESFFKGFGGFGSPSGLGAMREMEEHMARIREQMESRFEDMMGADPFGALGGGHGAASNLMRMENSTIAISDDSGSITVTRSNGKTHVEARDTEDKVIFSGPADTEEDRAKMPAEVREKVEDFEESRMNFGGFDQFLKAPEKVTPEVPLQEKAQRKSEVEKKATTPAEDDGD